MSPEFPQQIYHTLCSPTGETIPAKVIDRQPHNSNLLEGREDDIVRHPMTTFYTPQDETPVPREGHYISV